MRQLITALVAVLSLAAPIAASAQNYPTYSEDTGGGDAQIRGRILDFDGGYRLNVRDDRGYVDSVELHQGTIINPTGITLQPGMVVSILGYNAGSHFEANEVDTPYTTYGSVPSYNDHPWNFYGSGVTLGFFFGNTGWWHGSAFSGPYQYYGGQRVYTNVHVNNVYQGGSYQGRTYAVPQQHGGYYPTNHGSYNGGSTNGGYHGNPNGNGNNGNNGYHGHDNGGHDNGSHDNGGRDNH